MKGLDIVNWTLSCFANVIIQVYLEFSSSLPRDQPYLFVREKRKMKKKAN